MDVMDEDVLALWKKLNENKVEYIMIGGFATNLHGFQRYTGDLDIWLKDTKPNRKALRKAIAEYGLADMEEIERLEFIPGWTGITLLNFFTLDILTSVKGLENIPFDECLELASVADLEGIKVPFLHINHLVASKKASGRPKDLIDVIELEKIIEMRK